MLVLRMMQSPVAREMGTRARRRKRKRKTRRKKKSSGEHRGNGAQENNALCALESISTGR
ncbi:unnamed protein product, partial [Ascophyllum nodosum]